MRTLSRPQWRILNYLSWYARPSLGDVLKTQEVDEDDVRKLDEWRMIFAELDGDTYSLTEHASGRLPRRARLRPASRGLDYIRYDGFNRVARALGAQAAPITLRKLVFGHEVNFDDIVMMNHQALLEATWQTGGTVLLDHGDGEFIGFVGDHYRVRLTRKGREYLPLGTAPARRPTPGTDPSQCAICGDPITIDGTLHSWSGRMGLPERPYDHPATRAA